VGRFGDSDIKPLEVERKINTLSLSKKTKSHIKAQMHRLFEFALKCELIEFRRNPMLSVEIRGFRRRVRKKQVLTPERFQALLRPADLRLQVMMVDYAAVVIVVMQLCAVGTDAPASPQKKPRYQRRMTRAFDRICCWSGSTRMTKPSGEC
jgi:hypothetical protein